jgi:transcriptional regulator with PAS, ATPase and Fis domain
MANQGTLFLDEIDSMPLTLQGKLLSAIQESAITRLGGCKRIALDIRIISACKHDVEEMVREERFRPDLYYRLNLLPIHIPPLRRRKEDVAPLADYFISKFSLKYGKDLRISDAVLQALRDYSWPGNVRELENIWSALPY